MKVKQCCRRALPALLLEVGAGLLSNGLVPAKTEGLTAEAAAELGYVWGYHRRYRTLGSPLRERWEKAALRDEREGQVAQTSSKVSKVPSVIKKALYSPHC